MASEIRVNRLSNRSGLSTITFANGGVQFSGITTFANGDFRVGTGATILNPSTNEMQFHTGGSNRFTINNSGANLGTGNITAVDGTFTGNVSIAKTLTYEDVKNVDSVGVVTARTGVKVTGGDFTVGTAITASSVTGNVTQDVGITTFSGSSVWFKGATANKDMYWSHASGATVYKDNAQILMGNSSDLQIYHNTSNSIIKDAGTGVLSLQSNGTGINMLRSNGDVIAQFLTGGSVELYEDGTKRFETTASGINITGTIVATGADINGDIDVDGHTNLDNVSIAGMSTITSADIGTAQFTGSYVNVDGNLDIADSIRHLGDANTKIRFPAADTFSVETAGTERLRITSSGAIQSWYNSSLPVTDSRPILQLGYGVVGDDSAGRNNVSTNAYPVNGNSTWHYIGSSSLPAARYDCGFGEHKWYTAAAGTRGNDITWLEKLKIGNGYAGTVDVKGIPAHLRLYSQRDTSDWDATDPIGKLDFYVGDDTTNNLPYNAGFIHCLNETDNANEPSGALVFGTTTANLSGGATERLRIDSAGSVRIGNTTQNQYTAADDLIVGTGSGDRGITLYSGSADAGVIAFSDGTSDTAYRSGQIIYNHSANSMDFRTNGNYIRLTIDSDGDFGFGTTNTSGYSGHTNLFIGGMANLYAETTAASSASLSLSNNAYINSSGNWVYRSGGKGSNIYQYDGKIGFRTAGTGSAGGTITWAERFTIDHNHNIYIWGAQTGNNRGILYNGSSYFGIYGSSNGSTHRELRFHSAGGSASERMRITSTAVQVLNISGKQIDCRTSATTGNCWIALSKSDGTNKGYFGYGSSSNEQLYIVQQENADITIYNGSASRWYFKTDGQLNSATDGGINVYGGAVHHTNDAVIYVDKTSDADWTISANGYANNYGMAIAVGNGASYGLALKDYTNNTWRFRVTGAGTIYATNTTVASISDQRLKENIVDANSQWDDIKALRFRNFKWKADSGYADGKTYLGLISQEVETISPGLVEINAQTKEDIENGVTDPEYKNVKYSIVWMKAMKALQEAQARIETLEAEVAALKSS